MKKDKVDQLFEAGNEQLGKLHEIIQQTMKDEELIVENLLHPPRETLTPGQSLADKVARFGGSWIFIGIFLLLLVFWIMYNSLVPGPERFDPFPFILMNLVLSCIAALQAPIIMMSQNRQEEKDRQRAQNDYLVNLKAELEIRSLHQKVDLLLQEQMKTLYDIQQKQLTLLKHINARVSSNKGNNSPDDKPH